MDLIRCDRLTWTHLSRGANVVVNYAGSKDAAEAVAKEIEGMGVKALAVKVCLTLACSPSIHNLLSVPLFVDIFLLLHRKLSVNYAGRQFLT